MKPSPHIPVAVFLTSFHPGGTERQMTELIRRLDRSRFDVHVACFHAEGAWLQRIDMCATVTEFPIRGLARPSTLAQAVAFGRWCRRHRIAVLQTCDFYANAFALPTAAVVGVPVRVGSRREINPDKSTAQLRLQRHSYRCAHAVVANSRAAEAALLAEGVAADRVQVIPNGVVFEQYRARSGDRAVTTIVTVANLRKEKAHEVLLAAASWLLSRHPHLRFQIVGSGPRAEELRLLTERLGLAGRVEFLGHREDVAGLLASADAFVLPSRSEAFPNGVMEAMAAGLPVVASAVGGLLDLIQHERTGLLVPPDDPAKLGSAIESLVVSPARAASLGAAAREHIARHYSFDRMVQSFEDLYLSRLETAGAPVATRAAAA